MKPAAPVTRTESVCADAAFIGSFCHAACSYRIPVIQLDSIIRTRVGCLHPARRRGITGLACRPPPHLRHALSKRFRVSSPYTIRVIKDLEDSRAVFTRALADPDFVASVAHAAGIVNEALRAGHKILLAGNGGSAADAQHLATELMVRFRVDRAPLAAIALTTDTSALTAIGNDLGFEQL